MIVKNIFELSQYNNAGALEIPLRYLTVLPYQSCLYGKATAEICLNVGSIDLHEVIELQSFSCVSEEDRQ
jgi:hypothetical protein